MSRDRYEVGELLGSGNSTRGVFRAEQVDLRRPVALKILELRYADMRTHILAEGARMAQLRRHDHIVEVYDAGDWDEGEVYLAVELCDGGSLERLSNQGPVDPQLACRLISDACRGLHDLHQQGMLHLDVRPANVLLRDGVPKIADFGLARVGAEPKVAGLYAGHAAPEVYTTGKATASADQYAMGMTVGHILTEGRFCAEALPTPVTPKTWKDRPNLDTLGLHVPQALRRVLKKATAFDPSDRYDDVEAFKQALDRMTPAASFLPASDRELVSSDGSVTITRVEKPGDHHVVEVRVNGRRRNNLGKEGDSAAAAVKHVTKLVTDFSRGR